MRWTRHLIFSLTICLLAASRAQGQGTSAVLRCIFKGSVELHTALEPSSPVIARIDCGTSLVLIDHRSSSPHVRTKEGKEGYIISFNGGQWAVQPDVEDSLNSASLSVPGANASSNDVATEPSATRESTIVTRLTDDFTGTLKRLQSSVVTVWSEFGHGTGFIVDRSGLVLTNQHVVGPSVYIAVQSDSTHKIPATLVAASPEKDIAVLWTNLEALPGATVAPLTAPASAAIEGLRVLTIGSSLNQRKVMTTGVVRRVESRTIITNINLNPENSGGPLITSAGEVIGIVAFADTATVGRAFSGIIRIEEALPFIADSKALISQLPSPPALLLPVDPTDTLRVEALRQNAAADKFDSKAYSLGMGDFELVLITPTLKYRMQTDAAREAEKTKTKSRPFENYRGWADYTAEYKPVLQVQVTPGTGDSLWSVVNRGLSKSGVVAPVKQRLKADFYDMRLLCGEKEVQPIHPGKIAHLLNQNNFFTTLKDATYEGLYSYFADAISPACGQVRVEVYAAQNREKPTVKVLDKKVVERIAEEFAPYLKSR
jgi:S1-C subfamily serine protease